MKRWLRNEPMDVNGCVSGTTQFKGRTAEEAVARPGPRSGIPELSVAGRRGGAGWAGSSPRRSSSPGSRRLRGPRRPGRASRAQQGQKRGAPVVDGTKSASAIDPVLGPASRGPEDHLAGLIEATSDQVSLGPLAIPAEAFDEVLAEAQAALTRERAGNGIAVPDETPAASGSRPSPPRNLSSPSSSPYVPTEAKTRARPTDARTPPQRRDRSRPTVGSDGWRRDPPRRRHRPRQRQDARRPLRGPTRRGRADSAVDRRACQT